jgi:hypothetical protein
LHNSGGTVHLNGGIFTGRGGTETYGIINIEGGLLEGTGITATGEDGVERNDGLRNESGAGVLVTGGLLRGRGGADNRGVANYNSDSVLDLNQVTIHGEGGQEEAVRIGVSNEDVGLPSSTIASYGATPPLSWSRVKHPLSISPGLSVALWLVQVRRLV